MGDNRWGGKLPIRLLLMLVVESTSSGSSLMWCRRSAWFLMSNPGDSEEKWFDQSFVLHKLEIMNERMNKNTFLYTAQLGLKSTIILAAWNNEQVHKYPT